MSIASFTKGTANCYITLSTWLPGNTAVPMMSIILLACHRCNLHKGPNLSGIDPLTGGVMILFHPRRDQWADHFAFCGAYLEGLTPSGRTTVEVLALNDVRRLELRQELLGVGELT